jgi:hypothetical protein
MPEAKASVSEKICFEASFGMLSAGIMLEHHANKPSQTNVKTETHIRSTLCSRATLRTSKNGSRSSSFPPDLIQYLGGEYSDGPYSSTCASLRFPGDDWTEVLKIVKN